MTFHLLFIIGLAAFPIFELRGAIPIGIFAWGVDPIVSAICGVIGSTLIVAPMMIFLKFLSGWLADKFYFLNRFFSWLFDYAQKKHGPAFEEWRDLALFIICAIPLPMTGAYSVSIAAFVFGIPIKRSVALIFAGNIVAAIIVTVISVVAPNIINFF